MEKGLTKSKYTIRTNIANTYRKSPISAVLRGKDKSALIESALIEFSNKNHEIKGKIATKSTFLDIYACFQNRTIAKSALIETALSGDSLY